MVKKILLFIVFALFFSLSKVYAFDFAIRLEEPKSPTSQNSFSLNFVVLDIQNRPVNVKCFQKGPNSAVFSQFDKVYSLSGGGESGNCLVDASIIKDNGEYQFYTEASIADEKVTSNIVKVTYDGNTPGVPQNFNKEKIDSCQYKISFQTANDAGKTQQVRLYRSDNVSFYADFSTQVASLEIVSNLPGQFLDKAPVCDKTYYYAIRAFNFAGTGSPIVGDTFVKYVTVQVTPTPNPSSSVGPNSVSPRSSQTNTNSGNNSKANDVLGTSNNEGTESTGLKAANTEIISDNTNKNEESSWFSKLNSLWLFLIIVPVAGFYLYRRFRSNF